MKNKILVLGGTGRTGSAVIEQALARDLDVVALVRRPEAISVTNPKLTVINGTPLNAADVSSALRGCDAVISTLNNARVSDSPFAKPVGPADLMTDSIKNTVAAMQEQGVRRLLVLGAAGAGDSFEYAPWLFRFFIKRTNLSHAYRDHNGVEELLKASDLDWTIARAVMLGKKESSGPIIESYANKPKPAMQIHRNQVAAFFLDNLDNAELHQKAPVISQK